MTHHLKNGSKSHQKHHWQCGIELSSQSSDRYSKYNGKIHKLAHKHLSPLGISNTYLNIVHVAGMFFDWPDYYYSGGLRNNPNVSGKLGMKLAIGHDYQVPADKHDSD